MTLIAQVVLCSALRGTAYDVSLAPAVRVRSVVSHLEGEQT